MTFLKKLIKFKKNGPNFQYKTPWQNLFKRSFIAKSSKKKQQQVLLKTQR